MTNFWTSALIAAVAMTWIGCDCDQPGGQMEGKQCKADQLALSEPAAVAPGVDDRSPAELSELEGKVLATPRQVVWDEVDGAAYYQVRLHAPGGDCSLESELFERRSETAEVTLDPDVDDGEYLLCVVAYGEAGDILSIQQANITIDNTAPQGFAAYWQFSDSIGHADIYVALPLDLQGLARVTVSGSGVKGTMPECGEALKEEFLALTGPGLLNHHVDVTGAGGSAEDAGYPMNYRVCFYDAAGNVSTVELANVRTTLTTHDFFFTEANFEGDMANNLETLSGVSTALAGLDAADEICKQIANNGGKYRAVLADSTTAILDRLAILGPVRNRLDQTFARSLVDLLSPGSGVGLDYDVNGDKVEGGWVWSGISADGEPSSSFTCRNWGDSNAAFYGAYGAVEPGSVLSAGQTGPCNENRRLACISQHDVQQLTLTQDDLADRTRTITFGYPAHTRIEVRRAQGAAGVNGSCSDTSDEVVHEIAASASAGTATVADAAPAAGRYAYRICAYDKYDAVSSLALPSRASGASEFSEIFVTELSFAGDVGFDSTCSEQAESAGLEAGVWSGLTKGTDLSNAPGPLLDLSGKTIVTNASQLLSAANLLSPVDTTENLASAGGAAWTEVCSSDSADAGQVGATDGTWLDDGPRSCGNSARLYCIRTN